MDAPTRGTKRKRPEEDPAVKLAGKLHHDLQSVRQAAKKARTFETQRIVKKLKGLRVKTPESTEIALLEEQLDEVKAIEPDALAHTAFRTRLLKDKLVAANEHLRAAIERELTLSLGDTHTKVHARLLSAKALAAGVTAALADLRMALQPKDVDADGAAPDQISSPPQKKDKGKRAVKPAADEEEDEEDEEDSNDEEEEEGDADVEQPDGADEWESASDLDGDDAGWESGSIASTSDAPPSKRVKPPPTTASAPATKLKPSKQAESTFLPSLSVGFVRGGSADSDFEDDGDAKAFIDPRKNRRGQRARQAIWEKKYGRNANHKKKELEEIKARPAQKAHVPDAGWGARGRGSGGGCIQRLQASADVECTCSPANIAHIAHPACGSTFIGRRSSARRTRAAPLLGGEKAVKREDGWWGRDCAEPGEEDYFHIIGWGSVNHLLQSECNGPQMGLGFRIPV
ncbi:BUD22-domain-containing protein [Mycena rebaudengoi]|nr:BUD22-domain-containing protein [Mycena rebaudengoi]